MFDVDKWQEILSVMRRNKLRTLLTALTVAWGIFLLVLLVGFGNGLQNGIIYTFRDDAINSLWIYRGKSSLPYKGMPVGRQIQFNNEDYDRIRETIDGVEHMTSRFYLYGEFTISYKNKHSSFDVRSCHPDHLHLENTLMVSGRYLNDIDIKAKRKVAVVGTKVVAMLFGDENPLGKYINVNGIMYKVVGVFRDEGGPGEERKIYIPISTAQQAYGGGTKVHQIMMTVGDADLATSQAIGEQIRLLLAEQHNFSPNDRRAVFVRNNLESFQRWNSIIDGVALFLQIIAMLTIFAGIISISNIMLITVKERTKEIGVRKAMGATPWSIVSMVLQESIVITALSGYIGMVAGVAAVELFKNLFPAGDYFRNPYVDLEIAVIATLLMVSAGALAGLFPAIRAASIKPIEALRTD